MFGASEGDNVLIREAGKGRPLCDHLPPRESLVAAARNFYLLWQKSSLCRTEANVDGHDSLFDLQRLVSHDGPSPPRPNSDRLRIRRSEWRQGSVRIDIVADEVAKARIALDKALLLHPRDHGLEERLLLGDRAGTGKLCEPDGLAELVVGVGEVVLRHSVGGVGRREWGDGRGKVSSGLLHLRTRFERFGPTKSPAERLAYREEPTLNA